MQSTSHLQLRVNADGTIISHYLIGSPSWANGGDLQQAESLHALLTSQVENTILPRLRHCLAMDISEVLELSSASPLIDGATEVTIVPLTKGEASMIFKEILAASAAEERLLRERKVLENIIDLNPYAISLWDKDGHFLKANSLWWKWFKPGPPPGYSTFDPKMNPMLEKFDLLDLRDRILQGEVVVQPPFWFNPRQMGPQFPDIELYHSITFFSVPDQDGNPELVVAMCEDLADLKRAEENLAEINRERYDQVRAIAGGTAHEIKNALFPAVAAISTLEKDRDASESELREKVDRVSPLIKCAVQRAISMTDSVLDFSSLESERTQEVSSLKRVLGSVVEDNLDRIKSQGISINYDGVGGARIKCQPRHAHSVFSNLLLNAACAMEDCDRREIKISARNDNNLIRIEFEDSGPGVPEADRHRIFDAFYTTKPQSGTGLGLAVALKIVQMYDGIIHVEASDFGGARFVLRFPDPEKTDRFAYPVVSEEG